MWILPCICDVLNSPESWSRTLFDYFRRIILLLVWCLLLMELSMKIYYQLQSLFCQTCLVYLVRKSPNQFISEEIIVAKQDQGFVAPSSSWTLHFDTPIVVKLSTYILCQVTHFALGFELPGGWKKDKDAMIVTVLQVYW